MGGVGEVKFYPDQKKKKKGGGGVVLPLVKRGGAHKVLR